MGTEVPKKLGFGVLAVFTPYILYSAMNTSEELKKLDQQSSSSEGRLDACIQKTKHFGIHPRKQVEMCGCIGDTAEARGATKVFGSYDKEKLEGVIKSCQWKLGL